MNTCPICDYRCKISPKGIIRTDNLRSHVFHKHPAVPGATYEGHDEDTSRLKHVGNNMYVTLNPTSGSVRDGFCLSCATWVTLRGLTQASRIPALKLHVCKGKQMRAKCSSDSTPHDKSKLTSYKTGVSQTEFYKLCKEEGLEDLVEFNDELDIDVRQSLKNIRARLEDTKKALATPIATSMLEPFKKQKRFVGYVSAVERRVRDEIAKFNSGADEDEKEEFDEMRVFIIICEEAIKSQTFKDREREFRDELNKKDDESESLKCRIATAERERLELTMNHVERINESYAEIELRNKEIARLKKEIEMLSKEPHVGEEHPKPTAAAAPAPAPDRIQHLGGNIVGQWSLQYQG
jgi:hypothetical protein